MTDIKYPLEYTLNVKRGVAWAERKILLERERIRYFNQSKKY
jgi:hypothetical protein